MRSGLRARNVAGVLALAVVLLVTSCAIPLGDLGGPSSLAVGINEAGVIVGISEIPGSTPELRVERAFRRLPDGAIDELASLPGSSGTAAIAVNDAGEIAGMATMPGATPAQATVRLVRWDPDGTAHDLGSLGGPDATARAIDDAGRIIGWKEVAGGGSVAFVYDPAVGHVVDLPDLPNASSSVAHGMNDRGDVVGYQWVDGVSSRDLVPVRWDLDAGTVTDLSSTWGVALLIDINDAGTVIGQRRSGDGPGSFPEAAILRAGESAPTPLGAGAWSFPVSINDGEVVAGYRLGPAIAFRWQATTGVVNLTADGDSYAWTINDRGQIVGQDDGRATLYVGPDPLP